MMVPNPPSKMNTSSRFKLMNMPMIPAITCSVRGDNETGNGNGNKNNKKKMQNEDNIFSFFDEPTPESHQAGRAPLDLSEVINGFTGMINLDGNCYQEPLYSDYDSEPDSHTSSILQDFGIIGVEQNKYSPYIPPTNSFMDPLGLSLLNLSDDDNSFLNSVGSADPEKEKQRQKELALYAHEVLGEDEDDDFSVGIFSNDERKPKQVIFRGTIKDKIESENNVSEPSMPTFPSRSMIDAEAIRKTWPQRKTLKKTVKNEPLTMCDHCGKWTTYRRGNYVSKKLKSVKESSDLPNELKVLEPMIMK